MTFNFFLLLNSDKTEVIALGPEQLSTFFDHKFPSDDINWPSTVLL